MTKAKDNFPLHFERKSEIRELWIEGCHGIFGELSDIGRLFLKGTQDLLSMRWQLPCAMPA